MAALKPGNSGKRFLLFLTFIYTLVYTGFLTRYWKDKKGAVKRKSNEIERRQTISGLGDVAVLNPLEERIFALMGGDKVANNLDPDNEQQDGEGFEDSKGDSQVGPAYLKDKEVAVQKREINVTVIKKEQTSGALDDAAELNPLKERIVDLSVDDKITRNLDRDNDQHNSEYLEDSKDRQAEPAVNYNCKHKKGEVQNGTINEIFIKKEQTGDALEDTDDLDPLTERIVDISTDDDVTKNSEQDNDHLDSEYLEDSEEDRPAEPVKRRYRSPKRHERPGRKTRRNLLPKKRPLNRRSAMANLTERFIAIEERRSETESLLARSSAENMQAQTKVLAQLALAVNNLAEAIKTQPFRCNNCN
ncbi:uncharacterized protein LOC112050927 isoform X2 [Bicyclus anynana]|uniref:Uncharacterized protein LOC112050927 isoform X2 n=1 Tax=Bicyclus anynana TaxID=110368 RepID=A0A6J1NBG5_BICAN|nr:uncharacterized protein LOC112050927 isoform X2 [Bicyclus anynana]